MARKIVALIAILNLIFFEALPLGAQAAILPAQLSLIAGLGGAQMTAKQLASMASTVKKEEPPKVTVSFTAGSQGFKNGAPITATAKSTGFADAESKQYFTWFIKRNGCDLGDAPSAKCDADDDGSNIDVNDWKVAASKIMVQGTFNRNDASYGALNSTTADEGGGLEAVPSVDDWKKTYDESEDNEPDAPNCYIRDTDAGIDYELKEVGDWIINPCPTGWHPACVRNTQVQCYVAGDAAVRAAQIAAWIAANAAAIATCNTHYDQPGPVPPFHVTTAAESIQCQQDHYGRPLPYVSSPMETCDVASDTANTDAAARAELTCLTAAVDVEDLQNYRIETECLDSTAAVPQYSACVEDGAYGLGMYNMSDTLVAHIIGGATDPMMPASLLPTPPATNVCAYLAVPVNGVANSIPVLGTLGQGRMTCKPILDKIFEGGPTPNYGGGQVQTSAAVKPICVFDEGENACKHLFPRVPGQITGDGIFTEGEKNFWGAEPGNPRTNGTRLDEEVVMGLGLSTFTWSFYQGDRVGVIVEGRTNNPTYHNDSSKKIMWAFPTEKCEALNEPATVSASGANRSFYFTPEGAPILTAEADLDECLEENLLVPDDNGASAFKINMGYFPLNPINDPTGGVSGDKLTVTASPQNGVNLDGMLYEWEVYWTGDVPPDNNTVWHDITAYIENPVNNIMHSEFSGIGLNSMNFLLNLPNPPVTPTDIFYLKVRVRVTDESDDGVGTANGFQIIRVRQNTNTFTIRPTLAAPVSFLLSPNMIPPALCTAPADRKMCEVGRYDIVAIQLPLGVSNVSWTVNNKPFTCTPSISASCANTLYLPILGEEGSIIDVVATFVENGEKKSVPQRFLIAPPGIKISTMDVRPDGAQPKLIGVYKATSTEPAQNDYSSKVYQVSSGDTVNLSSSVIPTGKTASLTWSVDGVVFADTPTVSFVADKLAGDTYNVGLIAGIDAGSAGANLDNLRGAMQKHWGISPYYVTEENSVASLQIDVVDNYAGQFVMSNQGGMMASIITHLPQQAFFLLEIILTALALIFSMGLLFAFIPESLFKKDE